MNFLDWCDDEEGRILEILLAAFLAFPGIPTLAELVILKREMAKLFPVGEAQRPAPTLRKRPKPLMAWNAARVRQVEKQALERGDCHLGKSCRSEKKVLADRAAKIKSKGTHTFIKRLDILFRCNT